MKTGLLTILVLFTATLSKAQNTYLLSAANLRLVEFNYDTTGIHDMLLTVDSVSVPGTYSFVGDVAPKYKVTIKNIPMNPGKYIIYGDQAISHTYVPLVFEVDTDKKIRIISSNVFYKFHITDPSSIIFTSATQQRTK